MRLICPNCGAQYEVADDAIPATGRDVQCSNCGHGWFQVPHQPEAAIQEDAAPVAAASVATEAEAGPAPPEVEPAAPEAEPEAVSDLPEVAPVEAVAEEVPAAAATSDEVTEAVAATAAEPETPPTQQRSTLDDNLMAVLREEAEREVAQRKAEAARGIETQTELGIESAAAAPAAAAPRKTTSNFDFSDLSSDADQDANVPDAPVRPAARRDLLPDVEVISSTLRSSNGAGDDDNPMPDLPQIRRQSGFRSGFLLSVLLAVIVVVAYVLAPRLSEQFPAAKGALDAYVSSIDAFRVWLGSVVASVNGRLES